MLPRSEEWIARGKEVYERAAPGCGVTGDGNGLAATFMYKFRPRNFQLAVFKFRLVKGPLPTDGDLMRTITRGVRGTAMPPWHGLPIEDRLAAIQYIKYQLAVDRSDPSAPYEYFVDQPPGQPLYIGSPPPPTQALLDRGKEGVAPGKMLGVPRRSPARATVPRRPTSRTTSNPSINLLI